MKTKNPPDEEWRNLTPDQRSELKERDDVVEIPNWIAGIAAAIGLLAMICVVYNSYQEQPALDHPDRLSAESGLGH